ncbi:hypothetical protein F5Y12DRAFT_719090 [Xylaria sp. FL1777]|nr:hypothetical protein F5Y12DRAFT_719090 [Xylaria sp. FL1777]
MSDSDKGSFAPLMPDSDDDRSSVQWDTEHGRNLEGNRVPSRRHLTLSQILMITLILLVVTLISMTLAFKPTDNQCARQLSIYSPAMEAVGYVEYDFDNAFNSQSIYRGPPTDEREAAWHALTAQHGFEVPENKMASLNRTGEGFRRVPEKIGTGYESILEVFHQLHCLNTIRQYTWVQAGKYNNVPSKFNTSPAGQRMHVDHCIETIRLALMCSGDLTPVLVREAPQVAGGLKADFNAHHKCRDFEKIRKWHDEHWTIL